MDSLVLHVPAVEISDIPSDGSMASLLEDGRVLHFPGLGFLLDSQERELLRPELLSPRSRNISLSRDGSLKGCAGQATEQLRVSQMMARFHSFASRLVSSIAPQYMPHLRHAPTSFRPIQVSTRPQSWRADDRRLHVDAFPTRPNYGERILRVFMNLNPQGEARVWRVGEPFENIVQRFAPGLKPFVPWQARVLNAIGVTKSLRSEYDHIMLQLHDAMKADLAYQSDSSQVTFPFPPGSVWVCYSDQVSHAVMSGQYMIEQTFHLPVKQQYAPDKSPLGILERVMNRPLVSDQLRNRIGT